MRKPKLTRIERSAQRDYLASFRADYPDATAKELRAAETQSTSILLEARKNPDRALARAERADRNAPRNPCLPCKKR